jgi:hypothetical protein
MSIPIFTRGGKFGDLKASKPVASSFILRFPRIRELLKYSKTSGISKWPAIVSAPRRFSTASFGSTDIGIWLP